ncbi:MAG: CpaF family protein [Solirubrobacterales bacterium]
MSARREHSLDRFAGELRERAIDEARRRRLRFAGDPELLRKHIDDLVARDAPALSAETRADLVERVITASIGFGPLEKLFADSTIDEIMVNGHDAIWIERAGRLEQVDLEFESSQELDELIERMIAPLGRRVDESSPICDARLPDGSRVNVVIPPLSLGGSVLTIRRFRHANLDPDALVANGTLSARALGTLREAIQARRSILVSGGTGSGKTTLLNAISAFVPADERIVTIEDAAELRLRQGHVVRLEARPANLEGRGEISIRALVRTALRMRPDRILVGEVRGGEALDMLAAMTTGHDGSLTTVHANSASGALERVQTLALMSGVDVPHTAVRRMIGSAVDLVVHLRRADAGRREVEEFSEVIEHGGDFSLRRLMSREPGGDECWSDSERTDNRAEIESAVDA